MKESETGGNFHGWPNSNIQPKLGNFNSKMAKRAPNLVIDRVNIDLPEYQGSVEEVARAKCMSAWEHLKKEGKTDVRVIVEDTALCFNALGGLPGVYIKWFLKELKPEGLHRMLTGFDDKSAKAMCTFAVMGDEMQEPELFQGICPGEIVVPRGETSFGWDPCFQPDHESGHTFAEMDSAVKNGISHRSKALEKVINYFVSNPN
ncbi:Oidioi.mRNA.OKI2018_I69.chr2.g7476.t1.cds [Oikopleura dioica]|uniref:Inosine triphosphate pyrophosphatase n=1 Tax=Oikopleura dioica TaxID=34765 RepID=A0ABN7TB26_OIKDI|nr:Oidioi.mRNA.OKI2018_I69.chr2.g7476.t1.cds [Oikopleura dioica]